MERDDSLSCIGPIWLVSRGNTLSCGNQAIYMEVNIVELKYMAGLTANNFNDILSPLGKAE